MADVNSPVKVTVAREYARRPAPAFAQVPAWRIEANKDALAKARLARLTDDTEPFSLRAALRLATYGTAGYIASALRLRRAPMLWRG